MIGVAKMIREDRNMTKNDSFVEDEMMKVLELEIEMANVSIWLNLLYSLPGISLN